MKHLALGPVSLMSLSYRPMFYMILAIMLFTMIPYKCVMFRYPRELLWLVEELVEDSLGFMFSV